MNNISVLVLSCDGYSDLWEPFFTLKNRYWSNCPYEVFIATEEKECQYAKALKHKGSWTDRIRESLKEIKTDYVIIMCEDFFIREKVDQERIEKLIDKFDNNTASFNFELSYDENDFYTKIKGFKKRGPGASYKCSCQPGLWNRKILIDLLYGSRSAWEWELDNTNKDYLFYINSGNYIINYGYKDFKWFGVCKGKWCREIVPFFEKEGISIDYEKRGFVD